MVEGIAKSILFRSLQWLGVLALWERQSAKRAGRLPILAYHGVTEADSPSLRNRRRLHVPKHVFEEHLRVLSSRWHPVPLDDAIRRLREGSGLPARSVVVTFDDGYKNLLTVALPLLRRYGVPATAFVLTGGGASGPDRMWIDVLESALETTSERELEWEDLRLPLDSAGARERAVYLLGKRLASLGGDRQDALASVVACVRPAETAPDEDRDLLTWNDLASLKAAGIDIGSHATAHELLTALGPVDVERELVGSYATLERRLGPGHYGLAYPYGAHDDTVATAAARAGFVLAVTTDPGLNTRETSPFRLKRFLIGADDDVRRLRVSISGLRAVWATRRASSAS